MAHNGGQDVKAQPSITYAAPSDRLREEPPAPVLDVKQCLQSCAKFSGVPPSTHPLSFLCSSQWQKSNSCKSDISDSPSVRHLLRDSSMQFFSCSLSHNNTHLISDFSSRFNGSETPITDISDIVEKADTFL